MKSYGIKPWSHCSCERTVTEEKITCKQAVLIFGHMFWILSQAIILAIVACSGVP